MIARALASLAFPVLLSGCVSADRAPPTPRATSAGISAPKPPRPKLAGDFTIAGAIEQGGWIRGTAPANTASLSLGDTSIAVSPEGRFFAGLDRDAPAILSLVARDAQGGRLARDLRIARRTWAIERVNVPLRGSVPSETFMALRRPELAAIDAARGVRSATDGWLQGFIWPVKGRISGRFGSQRIYQGVPGSYHSGLDIAPGAGVPYVAPADGVVVLAANKPFSLEGNLLIIDHGMGLNSAFLHSSRLAVKEGDRVRQGQTVGYVGATGRASGPHLHWSLKWQNARLDPLLFLPPQ